MGRISRVSLIIGLILFPTILFAQFNNNTTSPYSRFGLGDLSSRSLGRTTAMGGASLASRNSLQINMANPASYNSLDSLAFLFEFGLNGKFSNFNSELESTGANDINFSYLAFNFRITPWMAASMGLTPYSNVGYNIEVYDYLENTGNFLTVYYGDGSLSRAYIGTAIQPFKNVSLGVNLNYLFGSLTHNAELYFLDASDFYNTQKYERIRIRQFGFDLGLQATLPLKNDQQIIFGAILENKPEYTAFKSDIIQKNLTASSTTDLDTLNIQEEEKGKIKFPLTYGAGVSYVKANEWEVNFDYYHQTWSDATFFGTINPVLTDLDKFAIGAEWIPEKFSIRSYIKRVAYRAGLKYEKSYLMLSNQQIDDFGITFGVGLPIYRSSSTINIAAELGRRGTKKNNLIEEKYAKLNLSVNLHDLWFIKRRYD
ncbi:hypothetical protein GM418_08030 [Maribellus comscasis]|uniref:Aromatic hydrocarbon degradation protein n=1 Tax=Maribellus comscasis TaxID=2681766 RepID=A0A6I6JRD2_9BACT|nr:hypothetical protein [Maribellus comscasis]QGY43610.1 hypothetical protein GM418_08030 [Maribellus comscasis]